MGGTKLAARLSMGVDKLGRGTKALVAMAAFVVVAAGLKLASPVIVPLLLAAVIAAATQPVVGFLRRHGVPNYAAVAITIVGVLGFITGLGAIVAVAAGDLSKLGISLENGLLDARRGITAWMVEHRLYHFGQVFARIDATEISQQAMTGALMVAPNILSALGVVLFVVIFILLEAATFQVKLRRALHWQAERFVDVHHTIGEVQKYLLVKTALSALTGVLCGTWCWIMGVENAVLWGLLAFLLNFIPVFGSVVATLLPTLFALMTLGAWPALAVLAGFLVVNNSIGNLVEPRVLGRAVGLSPLVVVVSIVLWGWILGPVGALLSVPLTMIVKIVLANTEDLRWVAVLLGPGEGRREDEYAEERRRERRSRTSTPGRARHTTAPSLPAFSAAAQRKSSAPA